MERDEITTKVRSLMERHKTVVQKKAELGGKLTAKREELVKLCEEIKAEGYDPTTLAVAAKEAEEDLLREISSFETDLVKAETALATFDKPVR